MKSIFSKKQRQNQTHTLTLPLIICICICIIILIVIINKYYEKFTEPIGNYDYMAPVTESISDEMWQILYNKMNKNGATEGLSLDNMKSTYTKFVNKTEINYYLDNGMFLWNPYVKKLFIDFISSVKEPQTTSPEEQLNEMMRKYPNRYAYSQYLLSPDMKEKLTSDAYLIYSGEKSSLLSFTKT